MGAWQVEEDSLTLSEPRVSPRGCEQGSSADHTLECSLLLRAVTASMVVNLSVLPFFSSGNGIQSAPATVPTP